MSNPEEQDQTKADDTFECNPDNDVAHELDELVHKVAVQQHIEELLDLDEDTLELDIKGDREVDWLKLHSVVHYFLRTVMDHMQIKTIIRDSQLRELKAMLGPILGDEQP